MILKNLAKKTAVLVALALLIPSLSFAADRKMAIQLNSADPLTQKMALLNARNLKAVIGKDNIDVELVVSVVLVVGSCLQLKVGVSLL